MPLERWWTLARPWLGPFLLLTAATAALLFARAELLGGQSHRPTAPGRAQAAARRRPGVQPRYYALRSGDTLGIVARRLGTSVKRLLALNPGVQPTVLHVGEQVRVG